MKKIEKNLWLAIVVFFLVLGLAMPLLAGNSISGTARCRVPHIISMSEEQSITIEKEEAAQDTSTIQTVENSDSLKTEDKSNAIIQKKEMILGETKEVELINTVCAR